MIAELKIIGAVVCGYPKSGSCARRKRGWRGEETDKLPGEYRGVWRLETLQIFLEKVRPTLKNLRDTNYKSSY